ncbi:MAG: hypothetical protein AB8B80_10330 [Marinicellaceae bacterium]
MEAIEIYVIYVIYGNEKKEEWENVSVINIDPYAKPDYSLGEEHLKKLQEESWYPAVLPNKEKIEIAATYSTEGQDFALNVRQNRTALLQVLCKGMPCVCFQTLKRETVNLQVHKRGSFDETKQA